MKTYSQIFVGVDWATKSHQVCVLDPEGSVVAEMEVAHKADDLSRLCDRLGEFVDDGPEHVLVSIEVPHGIVVETLLERGLTVHSINPKQLDRFRDRFTVAGAKDDRRDARVLADSLRTDRRAFREVTVEPRNAIELREWSRMHDDL